MSALLACTASPLEALRRCVPLSRPPLDSPHLPGVMHATADMSEICNQLAGFQSLLMRTGVLGFHAGRMTILTDCVRLSRSHAR